MAVYWVLPSFSGFGRVWLDIRPVGSSLIESFRKLNFILPSLRQLDATWIQFRSTEYRVLPSFTGFHESLQVQSNSQWDYRLLPSFTGFYWFQSSLTEVQSDSRSDYQVLPSCTEFYRVLPGLTAFNWILILVQPSFTEFLPSFQECQRPHRPICCPSSASLTSCSFFFNQVPFSKKSNKKLNHFFFAFFFDSVQPSGHPRFGPFFSLIRRPFSINRHAD